MRKAIVTLRNALVSQSVILAGGYNVYMNCTNSSTNDNSRSVVILRYKLGDKINNASASFFPNLSEAHVKSPRFCSIGLLSTVLGQNGSGQNGSGQNGRAYGQNGIRTKWYWTKWYGQNGTNKMV